MINHNNEAVLIDFGVSAIFEQEDDQLALSMGTYMYFAPEMFNPKIKDVQVRG